ncbi:ATP-grasp domain-containing protein [Risungbinella massiliensis]|uniref:ATP-grasp domain-containing protein n=1 Tax=Risungbinella massiliensis TaxID=1329796 RepID=UPI0005CC1A5B|nr:hypothetical protein [Risungbinella massiliensis]
MSVLILSRVAHQYYPYEEWMKDLGEDLVLLVAEEFRSDYPAEQYVHIESFPNYERNGNVELRALQLHEEYQFGCIIACSEVDIIRAAVLRERLGIEGQHTQSAIHFRDKTVMKEIAAQKGVTVPIFRRVDHSFDLLDFVTEHGYPVVVKPVDGAGSVNTSVLRSERDLAELLVGGLTSHLEVETFVEGNMYHVDGLVANGKLAFISASRYAEESGCLAFQGGGYNASYLLEHDNPLFHRFVSFTKNLLHALDTPHHTSFHCEVFHTPDDKIYLCEIASRTGGGRLNTYLEEAYGFHLSRNWVRAQCGLPLDLPEYHQIRQAKMTGDILVPPKKGTFLSGPKTSPPEWVCEYRVVGNPGDSYGGAQTSVDHIASFVVHGKSESEVKKRLFQAAEWFENEAQWQLF